MLQQSPLGIDIQKTIDDLRGALNSDMDCTVSYSLINSKAGQSDGMSDIESFVSAAQTQPPEAGAVNVYDKIASDYYTKYFPHFEAISLPISEVKAPGLLTNMARPVQLTTPFDFQKYLIVLPVFGPLNHTGICVIHASAAQVSPDDAVQTQFLLSKIFMAAQNYHMIIVSQLIKDAKKHTTKLTARETEILAWMARGKSNSVIADILGLSMHTVTGYVRNIYLKTQTNDRTSAAIYALSTGLLHVALNSSSSQQNYVTGQNMKVAI